MTDPTTTSAKGRRVFVVMSTEQRAEYSQEFGQLRQAGAQFVHETDPDLAVDRLGAVKPAVVIVGMEVEALEGLELLAMMVQKYPDFGGKFLVLPNKGDPFPAMLQYRDPDTGRSITEETDLEALAKLITPPRPRSATLIAHKPPAAVPPPTPAGPPPPAPPRSPAPPARAAKPPPPASAPVVAPPPPSSPEPAPPAPPEPAPLVQPTPTAPTAPPTSSPPPALLEEAARSKSGLAAKWPLLVAIVVGLGAITGIAVALSGDDDGSNETPTPTEESEADPTSPKSKAASKRPPTKEDGPDKRLDSGAHPPDEPAPETTGGDAPSPDASGFDLTQRTTLPLSFAHGSADYSVADEVRFDTIVAALKAGLDANPGSKVAVGGHTSREGRRRYNQKLGRRRAARARTALIERGIPPDRIKTHSFGSRVPVRDDERDDSPTGNRRATVKLVD